MSESDIEATGRIDLHSHVLPGIDDGCRNLADSLACIARFEQAGYLGTVCTPHIDPSQFPKNIPANIRDWVARLQAEIQATGSSYRLWPGGEVRIAEETWDWFERDGIPTLGPSRAVLLDWWGGVWPDFADETLDRLLREGYQPILAHPERMGLPPQLLQSTIASLQQRGIWLQGNLNSLSGGEGPRAQSLSQGWLKEGAYRLLASDMHLPERLEGRFAGLLVADQLVGSERSSELLAKRPQELILNAA